MFERFRKRASVTISKVYVLKICAACGYTKREEATLPVNKHDNFWICPQEHKFQPYVMRVEELKDKALTKEESEQKRKAMERRLGFSDKSNLFG